MVGGVCVCLCARVRSYLKSDRMLPSEYRMANCVGSVSIVRVDYFTRREKEEKEEGEKEEGEKGGGGDG